MREVCPDRVSYPLSKPQITKKGRGRELSCFVKLFGSEGEESSQYQRRQGEGGKKEDSPVTP